jgi:signal transduction histidine kinase
LRLRTKFLLSLLTVTTALTCATLFVVRRDAEQHALREIRQETLNGVLTFGIVQHEHEASLRRKADLLASVASMRNGDPTSIQEIGEDPWRSDEYQLLALADRTGRITALQSTLDKFPSATAQLMLKHSIRGTEKASWWFSGSRLYQIVLQPFRDGDSVKGDVLGTVVVGRGIDPSEFSRLSGSKIAIRVGQRIIASTLSPFGEQELPGQLKAAAEQDVRIDGERFFARSTYLSSGTDSISVVVLQSYDAALAGLQKQNRILAGFGLIAVLVGVALSFVVSEKFTRPLARLVQGVHALEKGDFEYGLDPTGNDEVADVTRAFDKMRRTLKTNQSQKLELENQLRQAQKMEAIGRLAGGVAHDFNNLLTVIKGHTDLMLDRMTPMDALHPSAEHVSKAADRAASLTRQLLAFSRMQVLQPKVLNLNLLVSEMSGLLKRLIREDISFKFIPDPSVGLVKADPGQIEQVVMNLIVNACDAMPTGGRLTIETRSIEVDEDMARARQPMKPGPYVKLTVEDTGQGMDADTRARIFEPFFTTKELGKGTGLGLATVYGVVKQSGGCIWVDSEPNKGARFEIFLPAVCQPEDQHVGNQPRATDVSACGVVLIAEDENDVRDLACEFMRSAGFEVFAARDGQEALEIAKRSQRLDVLLTDVVMPKMRGPELAVRLRAVRDDIQVIYMSGYLDYIRGSD